MTHLMTDERRMVPLLSDDNEMDSKIIKSMHLRDGGVEGKRDTTNDDDDGVDS